MVRKGYKEIFRKGKVTQAWNALNLFNLSRLEEPYTNSRTFFQQKWSAKAHTRTYHGKHVREKQWQRMFSRQLPAVVNMDAEALARDDGSKQAAGRGAGIDDPLWMKKSSPTLTPYMNMVYHPLERRLDTAIFRALFASSVRMARQYVIHGHVKVNGKRMKYPGYLLNPGDMFSVDPEMVLLGTGLKNTPSGRKIGGVKGEKVAMKLDLPSLKELDQQIRKYTNPSLDKGYVFRTRRKRRLYALRELRRQVKENLKSESLEPETQSKFWRRYETFKSKDDPRIRHMAKTQPTTVEIDGKTPAEVRQMTHLELLKSWPNVKLQDKPYLTPWHPRHWMSAFAFIPRYLEVNQNVCSAVYLRHPVARPGSAEVPTPYSNSMNMLAYQWYLRRR